MKFYHLILSTVLVGGIAVAGVANADVGHTKGAVKHSKPHKHQMKGKKKLRIGQLDRNKDGRISRAEFLSGKASRDHKRKANKMFNRLDRNNNGFISIRELKRNKAKHRRAKHRHGHS